MSVRKRRWVSKGETKEAWIAAYVDGGGARHSKTFKRRSDAVKYHAKVLNDVGAGIHTPDSQTITVAEAGALWLKSGEAEGLERVTLTNQKSVLDNHINPHFGAVKLSQLTVPMMRQFEDRLRTEVPNIAAARRRPEKYAPGTVEQIMGKFGALLAFAHDRGLVAQNVLSEKHSRRKKNRRIKQHQKRKLRIGIDIPTLNEMHAIVTKLSGHCRPVLLTAIFTGLRCSELRGLSWDNVNLPRGELTVTQRADRWGTIGRPKTEAGERPIPLLPIVTNMLREWKLVCPKGKLNLVFPNELGGVQDRSRTAYALCCAEVAAGVINESGRATEYWGPNREANNAKYFGLHCLRHFFASWCISRKVDGGRELPLKVVQGLMGHSSIQMTADIYGHLFPSQDLGAEMVTAEKAFFLINAAQEKKSAS